MRKPMPCPINRKQYLAAMKKLHKVQRDLEKTIRLFTPAQPVKVTPKAKRGRKARKAA